MPLLPSHGEVLRRLEVGDLIVAQQQPRPPIPEPSRVDREVTRALWAEDPEMDRVERPRGLLGRIGIREVDRTPGRRPSEGEVADALDAAALELADPDF